MRRPWLVIVGTVAVLLLIASPFLGAKWGSVDYRVLPSDAPAHVAADKLSDFGPETSTAQLLVRGGSEADVAAYADQVAQVDGVTAVQPVATEGDATLLRVSWAGNSQSEHSQNLIKEIRDVQPASGEVLVGGLSADTVDLIDSVGAHLPWMGLIVALVMLVLLFVAFGSLVLPVKAVVMNLFSITASFGVVTWIFSDGHLSGLIGFTPQGFLDATNPILMLAILFGLSMDYEVFLLSRVREQYDRTGDNDVAVATGVQKTGRIITSAAVLLAVVIGAFATQRHRFHEDARHRHARRPADRRDHRPCPPRPRDHEAARPRQLVGPRPAASLVGALRLPRGRRRRLGGTLPRPRAGRRLTAGAG